MPALSDALLRELCSARPEAVPPRRAFRICEAFGSLARWWLHPEVLRAAHCYDPNYPFLTSPKRPELPCSLGSCLVVFRTTATLPLLRRAFVLPLAWRAGSEHSPDLPPELLDLAARVDRQVRPERERQEQPWALHPADGLDLRANPLTGGLSFGYESGWAALAGGLIAASSGLLPCAEVWASGAWASNGLASIDGLAAKLALAVRWGVSDFFVPVWQMDKAQAWVGRYAPGRLRVGRLLSPADPKHPEGSRLALRGYLARLTRRPEAPLLEHPDDPEAFRRCRNYFLLQPAFTDAERAFYRGHLFPGIVWRLQNRVRDGWPQAEISHLATIVSPSDDLAVLATLAVGARHCLLLFQRDEPSNARRGRSTEELAQECQSRLVDKGIRPIVRPFRPGVDMWADVEREVAAFTSGVSPERVAIDLKPGTKMMTYTLSRVARPGNWLFNLEARFLDDRRTDPGTERPELWQVTG